jgi:hypothetical protein
MSNKSNEIAGNDGHFMDGATVCAWCCGGGGMVYLWRLLGCFVVEAV